ncbi:MAG TPA: TetR/AcrR family transcriptional regulator [Solirubrobacteraceae bacterium]|nr:TetR/AcrR family transcriptional regulator [Solirubrobacteraceae bacterium]
METPGSPGRPSAALETSGSPERPSAGAPAPVRAAFAEGVPAGTIPAQVGAAVGQAVPRARVPAAQRREELIAAAVHEFAQGGLHGTPVERIARRVGVAQPYVFSLFGSKRELFLAALERSFEQVANTFERAAAEYREGRAPEECEDALMAMGRAYKELLLSDRDYLMLQHQSYAACDDEVVRERVRHRYARLVGLAQRLSGAEDDRIDDFFRHGMALNVAAALGVEDLSSGCSWVRAELDRLGDSSTG